MIHIHQKQFSGATYSQQLIKDRNETLLFNLVRKLAPISRADLARHSGLSPATVTVLMEELLDNQWIRELPPAFLAPQRGRRPILLEVNAARGYVATVEILSRGYICTLYDICLHCIGTFRSREKAATSAQVCKDLEALAAAHGVSLDRLLGIHVLYPGLFDTESGRLGFSAVIDPADSVDPLLMEQLSSHFPDTHCMLSNNSTAMAYSVFSQNTAVALPLLALAIDEGISAGIVDGVPMLDLQYYEDSGADVDLNCIMDDSLSIIELQGTGEGRAFTNIELNSILDMGRAGVRSLMRAQRKALEGQGEWLLPAKCIVVATGNAHKLKELGDIFGGMVELVSMKDAGFRGDIVEDGDTFEANAAIKAEAVARVTGLPALADDSGLSVDALGGAPGVYSARYAGDHGDDQANNDLLLKNMANETNRTCRFVCAMALALPGEETRVVRGECVGELLHERAGEGGFGYDPLFMYKTGKTFAEMTEKEKNAVSHRAVASEKIREVIAEVLG